MSAVFLGIVRRREKLPEISAVYAMYGEDLECLYVGSTLNLKSRIAGHRYRKLAVSLAVFPCPEEDLRDVEERLYRAFKPSLNQASTIARSGYPSRPIAEDFTLRLESCGTSWRWRRGSLEVGYRTCAEALDNWKKAKEFLSDSSMEIMKESSRSLNQSTCLMWHVPVK